MNVHDRSAHGTPRTSATEHHSVATRRSKWVFGGFVAIVLLMLAVEHRIHLLAWLPWIILAACPLMHLFMHGGHGDGSKPGPDK